MSTGSFTMSKTRGFTQFRFALKQSIIALAAAGFSQGLLAGLVPPNLTAESDPFGFHLAMPSSFGYGGSSINLNFSGAGTNGTVPNYTLYSSFAADMSGASEEWAWAYEVEEGKWAVTAKPQVSSSMIDPQNWAATPKKIYYQIAATDPDSGSVVRSNVLDVNYFLPPFFLASDGRYLPTDTSAMTRHIPIYVPPGAGKTKLGSVMIFAPDLVPFKELPPTLIGGTDGTISVENGIVYFTATDRFGMGVNEGKAESFTIDYPVVEPVSGVSTGFANSTISIAVIPADPADVTPPQFKVYYNGLPNNNMALNGSPANPIVRFTQNVPEPDSIVKTWQAAKLALVQTAGQPCPLFSTEWQAVEYMNRTGSARACLARDPDPGSSKIYYFSPINEGLDYEQLQWPGNVGLNAYLNPETLSGPSTIAMNVDELAPNGSVTRTHALSYQSNFVVPQTYSFDVIPSQNVRKVGDYYVVHSSAATIADYQITSGDPAVAFRNPLKPPSDISDNFSSGTIPAYIVDKRDPESLNVSPWNLPPGGQLLPYFLAQKEAIPVSIEKQQGGAIKVFINKNTQALGGYKFTLQRISSTSGTITIPEDDATFRVGDAETQWVINNDVNDDHKTTSGYAKVAVVTISQATLDAVKAAGDFLTIRWDADLSNVDQELRDDPSLNSEYFSGNLNIEGYSATVGIPAGDIAIPTLMWRGEPSNTISLPGATNVTRVDWTITRVRTGAQIVDSKNTPVAYDVSALSAGDYTVTARLANAMGDFVDTAVKSFTIYDRPTATITVPTVVNRGTTAKLSAVAHGIPATGLVRWEVGGISYPAQFNVATSTVTGDFLPDSEFPSGKVKAKLIVQVDPNVTASTVEFVSEGEMSVGDIPSGTISTKAKILWAGKSAKIDFAGNSAAKRIDWLVTSPFGQTTTVAKADLSSLDTGNFVEGTYTISAKVYNEAGTPTTLETPFIAKVYKEPKISLTAPTAIGAGSSIIVKGTYNTLPANASAKFVIGETEIDATVDRGKSTLQASYVLPLVAPATYPVSLKVLVDPTNPDSEVTYTANPVKALAYSPVKVTVTAAPAILDIGVQGVYKATVKASWDTKALPITGNGLMGEWELPDGTIKSGLNMVYTPTEADFALYSAGRKPVFRAWLDGSKEATLATVTPASKMYDPWVMPEYTLFLKKGAAQVTAPDSVVLILTPDRKLDSKMASYRGISYKWTLPTGAGIVSQAVRDTLTMTANQPGVYPVSVDVTDKYGAIKTVNFSFEAIPSTFKVDSLSFKGSTLSNRVPVMVIPKLATSSSHKKERPSLYEMIVNGTVVASGTQPKPVTLTTEGAYNIGVRVTSNFNSVATRTEPFVATPNQVPVCPKPFRLTYGKIGTIKTVKAAAQCKDLDGRIKGYTWTVDGSPASSKTDSQSYQFPEGVTSVRIEVSIKDDSGDITTYGETVTIQ
jgi:hypothetical protein